MTALCDTAPSVRTAGPDDAPVMAAAATDQPAACPLARWQARTSNEVTNRLHRSVSLEEQEKQLLLELDGTKPAAAFDDRVELLERLARKGLLAR